MSKKDRKAARKALRKLLRTGNAAAQLAAARLLLDHSVAMIDRHAIKSRSR